jgi:arylsulfatase A-like enzyme
MANEQERHARNRLIDETRAAVEKLIREYRKAAKVSARTAEEHEREWNLAKLAQGVERERDLALREAEKFKAYSRQADQEIAQLRAELARLTTPRPIAEAPRDGTVVIGCDDKAGPLERLCIGRRGHGPMANLEIIGEHNARALLLATGYTEDRSIISPTAVVR